MREAASQATSRASVLRASADGPFAAVRLRGTCSALRRRLPPVSGVAAERLYLAKQGAKQAADEAAWLAAHEKAKGELPAAAPSW